MNSDDLVFNEWLEQISHYDKLKLDEAQELCRKGFESLDVKRKKLYLDKVVLGTLYVVSNYITRNNLSIFSSRIYDTNDLINSFVEVWIKRIYNGKLLSIDNYSDIFTKPYFNEVYQNLIGNDIPFYGVFNIPSELFANLLHVFIQFKNKGLDFTYNDLIKFIAKDEGHYWHLIKEYDSRIMLMLENIYNNLNYDKDECLKIGITKISDYLKLFIDIGITESISENILDNTDMESDVINKVLFGSFVKDIDKILENDKQRQIIHQRYGLDDKIPKTLEEVAKIHNISRARVNRIEAKSLRLLRSKGKNIKNYI